MKWKDCPFRMSLGVTSLVLGCQGLLGIEEGTPRASDDAGTSAVCTLPSDCPDREVCLFERCSEECLEDRDCPDGSRCLSTGSHGACVSRVQASCLVATCPAGTVCSDEQCRTPCSAGCLEDQECVSDVCVGTDPAHDIDARPDASAGGSGGTGGTPGGNAGIGGSGGLATGGAPGTGGTVPSTGGTAGTDAGAGSGGVDDGGGGPPDACTTPVVDIVIAVDTGGSMASEWAQVTAALAAFADGVVASAADIHVVMIAGAAPTGVLPAQFCMPPPLGSGQCGVSGEDSSPPGYLRLTQEVGSNDALDLILALHPQFRDTLRPGAQTFFWVITDDNAGIAAAQFTVGLAALTPPITSFRFFGLACTVAACGASCAADATTYLDLAQSTGGIVGMLCGNPAENATVLGAMAASMACP